MEGVGSNTLDTRLVVDSAELSDAFTPCGVRTHKYLHSHRLSFPAMRLDVEVKVETFAFLNVPKSQGD